MGNSSPGYNFVIEGGIWKEMDRNGHLHEVVVTCMNHNFTVVTLNCIGPFGVYIWNSCRGLMSSSSTPTPSQKLLSGPQCRFEVFITFSDSSGCFSNPACFSYEYSVSFYIGAGRPIKNIDKLNLTISISWSLCFFLNGSGDCSAGMFILES